MIRQLAAAPVAGVVLVAATGASGSRYYYYYEPDGDLLPDERSSASLADQLESAAAREP